MKTNYLPLIAGLVLSLCACKKDLNGNNNGAIVGKWYENKLSIKQQTLSSGVIDSITFTGNDFNTSDYFQFKSDSTAVLSNDGTIFNVTGKYEPLTANSIAGGQLYYRWYKVNGPSLSLQVGFIPTCLGCPQPGPSTQNIVKLDANNLVLRAVIDTSNVYKVTTETWYTRGN